RAHRRGSGEPLRPVAPANQTRERCPRGNRTGDELFFVRRKLVGAGEQRAVLSGEECGSRKLGEPSGDLLERQLRGKDAAPPELQRDRDAGGAGRTAIRNAKRGT